MIKINKRLISLIENRFKQKLLEHVTNNQFSLEVLDKMKTFKEKVAYCRETLGKPLGVGSSRITFDVGNNKVLKLAKNNKGLSQNNAEDDYMISDLIKPEVYKYGENNSYIVSEKCRKIKKTEFKNILGITYEEYVKFINNCRQEVMGNRLIVHEDCLLDEETFVDLLEENETLNGIRDYITDFQITTNDITRLANLGVALSDNRFVILDTGLSEDVFNDYYK